MSHTGFYQACLLYRYTHYIGTQLLIVAHLTRYYLADQPLLAQQLCMLYSSVAIFKHLSVTDYLGNRPPCKKMSS